MITMAKFKMRKNLTDEQRDYLIQQIAFTPAPEVKWIKCENDVSGVCDKNHVIATFISNCLCKMDQQLFDQLYELIEEIGTKEKVM